MILLGWEDPTVFWTATMRSGPSEFTTCSATGVLSTEQASKIPFWAAGQPDNKNGMEDCVSLFINKTGSDVKLMDRRCDLKYLHICMV